MENIQFNEDGSIKLPEYLKNQKEEETTCIILRRETINGTSPAIDHLRIEFPADIFPDLNIIFSLYESLKHDQFADVLYGKIKQEDEKSFFIEARETRRMCEFLEHASVIFETGLRERFLRCTVTRGIWDRDFSKDRV